MEDIIFWRGNAARLFRRFGEFRNNPGLFMSPLPFEVKYTLSRGRHGKTLMELELVHGPIPVGALFLCWEQCPDLFTVPCGPDGTGRAYILSFSGSPLSGSNTWTAVCPETGETVEGSNAPHFMKRCAALDAAVSQCREALGEYIRRKGLTGFEPASLRETVAWLDGNGND